MCGCYSIIEDGSMHDGHKGIVSSGDSVLYETPCGRVRISEARTAPFGEPGNRIVSIYYDNYYARHNVCWTFGETYGRISTKKYFEFGNSKLLFSTVPCSTKVSTKNGTSCYVYER